MDTPQYAQATKAPEIIATCAVCIAIPSIALLLRIWSRLLLDKLNFWWDDYLAVLAWILSTVNCILTVHAVHIGLGRHFPVLLEEGVNPSKIFRPIYFEGIIYSISVTVIKLSAICFYARVFQSVRPFRILLWTVGGVTIACWVAFIPRIVFSCLPVQKFWEPDLPGHCSDIRAALIAGAASNVFLDAVILLLPMPMIWRLQLNWSRKIGLFAVFAVGYCMMVLSIARLVSVSKLHRDWQVDDPTWTSIEPLILEFIEPSLGIVSICMPSCFTLIKEHRERGLKCLFTRSRIVGPSSERVRLATGSPVQTRDSYFLHEDKDDCLMIVRPTSIASTDSRNNGSLSNCEDNAAAKASV